MDNLRFPSFLNGLPVPKGLEKAQELREKIKKIDGVKAVFVEEYQVLLELSPAIVWEDISNQIRLTIGSFFNEREVELVN